MKHNNEVSEGICPGHIDTDRRGFLQAGMGGFLSLFFAQWLGSAQGALAQTKGTRPKSCILLWMNGGPSHLETFDPKPGTTTGGSTRAIKTRIPGIELAAGFPQLAEVTDKIAILRGMTSKEGNHQRAQYLLHTGYAPNPTITHPSLGAWVNAELGVTSAELPNFVSISGPSMGAGFLGVQYAPFVVQNPNQSPQNIAYARNVTADRFDTRMSGLNYLEQGFHTETQDNKVKGHREVYGKAVRMMRSPRLKAFDIKEEPSAVQQAYGSSNFGKGCLMARRLVESGVRFVEVVQDGWDTHNDNFNRTNKLLANVDPAMATLIKDLEQRNLLESTLIIWMGEFGRTPRINGNEGRDHYPQAWNVALAGGGVRAGVVYGATDEAGAKVVDKPVLVPDLFATVSTLLGMKPDKTLMTNVGRPISLTEKGKPIIELIA
ncbi:MAG: DUF1501 domain-containing protein [Armatimonadetes bacterium]|nr:DUF1501 domain-containing protein [Armatimonadota bacterium]